MPTFSDIGDTCHGKGAANSQSCKNRAEIFENRTNLVVKLEQRKDTMGPAKLRVDEFQPNSSDSGVNEMAGPLALPGFTDLLHTALVAPMRASDGCQAQQALPSAVATQAVGMGPRISTSALSRHSFSLVCACNMNR